MVMPVEWELLRSGPEDAEHGVLMLPGGASPARSYDDVMAQPILGGVRLVAATLPGHVGTPPPEDFSIESCARAAAVLAADNHCDVVVGYSMGATVAVEVAASGLFPGPVVLLGVSLSPRDEPAFFRAVVRLGAVLGGLPSAALMRAAAMAVRGARVPEERRARMRADLRRNDPRVLRHALRAYLDYLGRYGSPAERLCGAGVPVWVVHAEKGDGGLTDEERRTLEACPHTSVVTVPGSCFFLPDEEPQRVAGIIAEAVGMA